MKCPQCGRLTQVLDSRRRPDYVYRRRVCRPCNVSFTTHEVIHGGVKPKRGGKPNG